MLHEAPQRNYGQILNIRLLLNVAGITSLHMTPNFNNVTCDKNLWPLFRHILIMPYYMIFFKIVQFRDSVKTNHQNVVLSVRRTFHPLSNDLESKFWPAPDFPKTLIMRAKRAHDVTTTMTSSNPTSVETGRIRKSS